MPSHKHATMTGVTAGRGNWGDGSLGPSVFGTSMGSAYQSYTSPVGSNAGVPIVPPYVALLLCRKN
ncbi:hypothetical protein BQ8794_60100 [Mesorhizobium prunaredense]|uniref:Uncharacterized protein n=1 Tax=Mesorhizobium prunaredense TaxID=1631249 RepID=A0A1R3VG05_9HYPH|nr:hypothetical protein BQ8794_60100 [Mesorhizobium prunaredense]